MQGIYAAQAMAHKHNRVNVADYVFHVSEITIKPILAIVFYDNFVGVIQVLPNIIETIPGGTGTMDIDQVH
jgi:hypothetical protein